MNKIRKFIQSRIRKIRKVESEFILSRLEKTNSADNHKIKLTCYGVTDGGCSQLLRRVSALALANHFGYSYLHTPPEKVSHNYGDISGWDQLWDDYLNLGHRFALNDKKRDSFVDFNSFLRKAILSKTGALPSPIPLKHGHFFTDARPESYLKIKETVLSCYYANSRHEPFLFQQDKINVAIHARRGDVGKNEALRFTSGKKIRDVIAQIKQALKATDLEADFHLFSAAPDRDLLQLESEGIQVHHQPTIFEVLDHLIHADILVSSKSSVGHLSGILSNGVVLYEPFWHSPLPNWIVLQGDVQQELRKKLSHAAVTQKYHS